MYAKFVDGKKEIKKKILTVGEAFSYVEGISP